MATGKSGYIYTSGHSEFGNADLEVRIGWSEEYDIATNKSVVKLTSFESRYIYGGDWYIGGTLSVDGVDVVAMENTKPTHWVKPPYGGEEWGAIIAWEGYPLPPWTSGEIEHNADGSKNVTIGISLGYWRASNDYFKINETHTIALTTIPRASSFTVSNGTLGTAQNLTVDRKSTNFSHTITYQCGTDSGEVCNKSSSDTVSFTPPLALASQNTVGTSVSVTFTLQTYSGDTAIGNAVTQTVTMAIPDSVKPSLTLALSDNNGYANNYGFYVKGLSQLKFVVSPTLAYGSEIFSYNVQANGNTYNVASDVTDALKSAGTLTVTATVTDKRGRSETASANITVLDYVAPALSNVSVIRCNSDGSANPQGANLKVTFSAAITALNNKNAATYTLKYRKVSATSYTSAPASAMPSSYTVTNHSYRFAAEGSPYVIEITAADNHYSSTRSITGPAAIFLIAPHESGTALGLGMKPIHETGLDIGFDVYMNGGKLDGKTISWRDNGDGTFTLIGT